MIPSFDELKNFFKQTELPKKVELAPGITIVDLPNFIDSHLQVISANAGKPVFDSFFQRLCLLKKKLEDMQ